MSTEPEKWRASLQRARTREAVVAVMQQYARQWLASDLATLPECCRNLVFDTPLELLELSLTIAREELTSNGDAESSTRLRQLALVFSAAAMRLAEVTTATPAR